MFSLPCGLGPSLKACSASLILSINFYQRFVVQPRSHAARNIRHIDWSVCQQTTSLSSKALWRRRLRDELHSAQCRPVGLLTWKEFDRLTGRVIQL